MVNLIRRFQQPLMIFITVLVIVAFVWLYNANSHMDRGGSNRVGTIYGKSVSHSEFLRTANKFQLARDLGLREYLEALIGQAMTLDQATENFVWNSMVLRHEAREMGIQPTEAEVEEFVKNMEIFQVNGTYDGTRFVNFVQNALSPRGFSEEQLFELIRDNLRLQRIKQVLGSTVAAAPSEVRRVFEQQNQKIEASVIRFKLDDFLKEVKLTEEDLKKAYEERKASLNSEEKRKVKFVAFKLADDQKSLAGKERMDALQALADEAGKFSVAMLENGAKFEDVAAQFKVPVQVSPEFTQNEPPKELGSSRQAAQAAFNLTKEQPNSDAITTPEGYYVLQLAETIPARPLTFEEAKSKLETQLKNERAQEQLTLKATEVRNKIAADLKAGKSFADAAKSAGVTPEPFPAFSPAEPKFDAPDAGYVMSTAFELKDGELSQPVPAMGSTLLVYVNKRLPVDDQTFEKERATIVENISSEREHALFLEWLKSRRTHANITGASANV